MITAVANGMAHLKESSYQQFLQLHNQGRGQWDLVPELGVDTTNRDELTAVYPPSEPPNILETNAQLMIASRLNNAMALSFRQGVNARYLNRVRAAAATASRRAAMSNSDIDNLAQTYISTWEMPPERHQRRVLDASGEGVTSGVV